MVVFILYRCRFLSVLKSLNLTLTVPEGGGSPGAAPRQSPA